MKTADTAMCRSPKEVEVFKAVLSLAEEGVDLSGVRVQQIADAAGMGKGTLYEYFKSKDEILAGTVRYCIAGEIERIEALVSGAKDFEMLLDTLIEYVTLLVLSRAASYFMVGSVLQRDSSAHSCDELLQGAKVQVETLNEQGYRLALAGGCAADVTLEYFRQAMYTAMVGYATVLHSHAQKGSLSPEELAMQKSYLRRIVHGSLR